MSTTIIYKGSEIANFDSGTKTLKTSGKYCEDDITVESTGGSQVYFNANGSLYTPHTVIPNDNNIKYNFMYRGSLELEYFESLRETLTTTQFYVLDNCPKLRTIKLPYITAIQGVLTSELGDRVVDIQIGSIGHPVIQMYANTFGFNRKYGSNVTVTIYVNANTLADIPSAVIGSSPWGAIDLGTIIYRNSTTGEVITQ